VQYSVRSLLEQDYPGHLQLLIVLDGAVVNRETYTPSRTGAAIPGQSNRSVRLHPESQRGGRVSATNTGLLYATAKSSWRSTRHFVRPATWCPRRCACSPIATVVGTTGPLRVRNSRKSLVTRLQAIEYMQAIYLSKVGLAEWDVINNSARRLHDLPQVGAGSRRRLEHRHRRRPRPDSCASSTTSGATRA